MGVIRNGIGACLHGNAFPVDQQMPQMIVRGDVLAIVVGSFQGAPENVTNVVPGDSGPSFHPDGSDLWTVSGPECYPTPGAA
jgi:hypothetical protein